jgi:hypothetical protein
MKKSLPATTVFSNIERFPLGPINAAEDSFKILVDAWSNYQIVSQVEKTRRAGIVAWRETKVLELNNQKEVLEYYLKETFKERAKNIEGFFAALDKGLESGNDKLIEQSIGAILEVSKQSPLAAAKELLVAMRDPNVKAIEI